jgi:CBS domain-containing protein
MIELGLADAPHAALGAGGAFVSLVADLGGSVLVGVVAGLVLSILHGRTTANLEVIAVLAAILAAMSVAEPLRLNFLLVSTVAGVMFINMAADPGRLEQRLEAVGGPLFALLFVLSGFRLKAELFTQPAMLAMIGAYVVARTVGKVGGSYAAVRAIGPRSEVPRTVGMGLLCHAEDKIDLMAALSALWITRAEPEWVESTSAVAIGSVAVFELAGPLLLRHVVVAAGEVKAFRLFHAPDPAEGGRWRQVTDALLAALRRIGVSRYPNTRGGPLTARHVMHPNVDVLRASAGLDEVLHFIDRSHVDHFPVVDAHSRFLGTIDLADVREILYEPDARNLVTAQDLLEDARITAGPDEPLSELFEKLQAHRAHDLIVLDEETDRVLGMVEQRDVLRAMHVEQTGEGPAEH